MDVVKREGTIIRSIWSTREGWKWGEMLTLDQCEEGTKEAECAMSAQGKKEWNHRLGDRRVRRTEIRCHMASRLPPILLEGRVVRLAHLGPQTILLLSQCSVSSAVSLQWGQSMREAYSWEIEHLVHLAPNEIIRRNWMKTRSWRDIKYQDFVRMLQKPVIKKPSTTPRVG